MTAPEVERDEKILTPDALRFLKELHQKFDKRRLQLLAKRKQVQSMLDDGALFPDFVESSRQLRDDRSWTGAKIPEDMLVTFLVTSSKPLITLLLFLNNRWSNLYKYFLKDRRVEITGPTDRKMVINALNSGAKVFMADFEDANTPSWRNQLEGQMNLYDAVREEISYKNEATRKLYTLNKEHAG